MGQEVGEARPREWREAGCCEQTLQARGEERGEVGTHLFWVVSGLRERNPWFGNAGRSGGTAHAGSSKRRHGAGAEGVEREPRSSVIGAGLSMGLQDPGSPFSL